MKTAPLIRFVVTALAAGLLMLLGGCAGGGVVSHFPGGSKFVLSKNVVELDKTTATVTSVTPTQVVLETAPALLPGQILIHNELGTKRFLRKVTAAHVSGTTTTVDTADATVEDVFATADILQQSPFTTSALLQLQPAQPGVTFTAPTKSGSTKGAAQTRGDGSGINVNFANFQMKDDSNHVIAEINGTIFLDAGIETRFSKPALVVDEFYVAPYATIRGSLTARGRETGSFTKEFPVSLNIRIPVTPLGPLGINCDVQLTAKVEGSFDAEGKFVVTASVNAKEGVQYTSSGGWGLINQFDHTLSLNPPSFRGSLEMGVSLVRPQVGADLLGIGEVHVTADVVKVIGRITAQSSPVPGFWIEGLGDFTFTAGGSLRLGPINLWNDSKDFNLGRFNIMEPFLLRDLAPTETIIAYTDLGFKNLHAMYGDGSGDHVIVTTTTFVFAPSISNQTGRLCYAKFNAQGKAEIWTANNDGSGAHQLTDGTLSANHCTWNPDGTEIAFDASDANLHKQIYVVNATSGAIRQLSSGDQNSRVPTWSADGTMIYYEQSTTIPNKVIARTLSDHETFDIVLADDTTTYAEPSLSPNGMMLVCLKGGSTIVVSDEQGRGEHVILADPHLSRPTFSPDGTRILMQYNDVGTIHIQSYDLNGLNGLDYGAGQQASWGMRH